MTVRLVSPCRGLAAELPGACHVCSLTLVSSPHLARSYHHLFPVRGFDEVPPSEVARLDQVGLVKCQMSNVGKPSRGTSQS